MQSRSFSIGPLNNPLTVSLYSGNAGDGHFLPPGEDAFWIDNLGDRIVTNTGAFIIFNPA